MLPAPVPDREAKRAARTYGPELAAGRSEFCVSNAEHLEMYKTYVF